MPNNEAVRPSTTSSSEVTGEEVRKKTANTGSTTPAPYESVVSQVVGRVQNEPFLFVIAIAALLIGLTVLAAGIGSPDMQFTVVTIASLAVVVILGYYVLKVMQVRGEVKTPKPATTAAQEHSQPAPESTKSHELQSKYNTEIHDSTVALGDNASIMQNSGGQGSSSGSTDVPVLGTLTPQERRKALEQQLAQHQRNLLRLQAKKAVYAGGEEPLSLLNQIADEEQQIQHVQIELANLPAN